MRIHNAAFAWVITAFFALSQCLQAQETIEHYSQRLTPDERAGADFSKPINILSDQNGRYTLVFSDAAKGIVIKTMNIKDMNPFKYIGEKVTNGDSGEDLYKLKNKIFKDVFSNFQPEHDTLYRIPFDTAVVENVWLSSSFGVSKNGNYCVVVHYMCDGNYGCRAQFTVFDSTMTEISRFSTDNPTSEPVITNNGKFVAFIYYFGDSHDEEDYSGVKAGVKIIKIHDNQIIVNKKLTGINGSGIGTKKNLIYTSTTNYQKGEDFVFRKFIFDMDRMKLYSRELKVDCYGRSKLLDDGILMRCQDGESYMLLFDRDFDVEDLP